MTPTLHTYFAAFRDAVKYHAPGAQLRCKRLNAFRVFQQSSAAEMTAPTLGATICDKHKPYFYSRLWHEKQYNPNSITFEFPLLFIFETEAELSMHNVADGALLAEHKLQVGVIDIYTEPKPTNTYCAGCEGRTINEIYSDTEQLLYYALNYVANVGYEVAPDGLEYMLHFAASHDEDKWYPLDLLRETYTQPLLRIERPAERIYGTATFVKAVVRHCAKDVPATFLEKDFGTLSHEAGCSSCD